MKVKVSLVLLLLLIGAAVGYLLGTEKGRAQRDLIVVKVRERRAGERPVEGSGDPEGETIDITGAAADTGAGQESDVTVS